MLIFIFTYSLNKSVMFLTQMGSNRQQSVLNREYHDVNNVISQIMACPAWSEASKRDIKTKENILQCLELISRNNNNVIRKAIESLFLKYPNDTSVWSRIFLLNRYIFQVPTDSPIDDNLFGGWVGIPIHNQKVNRLWPFSVDNNNNLILVGVFEGYFGNGYRGLDEFDYFLRKYGIRKK